MSIHALIVGVSNYDLIGAPNLGFCKNDIKYFSEALIKGLSAKKEQIVKLGENDVVKKQSFINVLRKFDFEDENEDTFIFYFSGHGGINCNKHFLIFSDGYLETEDLIEYINKINVKNKLLIFDTCYSGHFEINSLPEIDYESSLKEFIGTGYAVLASSSANQYLRNHPDSKKQSSLFTSFLNDALTARILLKEGKKSLDDIINLLFKYMKIRNIKHPEYAQTPIFRSKLGGTIFFSVEKYIPYVSNNYFLEREKYKIYQVEPIHNARAKRYKVKVILKDIFTLEDISKVHKEIVSFIKNIEVYKSEKFERYWKGKSANIIFCYYGKSEDDILNSNFLCKTIWVDDTQDKDWWYNLSNKSKFVNDVYFDINSNYESLNKFYAENTADDTYLIHQTKDIIINMINLAEMLIKSFNELLNEEATEKEFIEEFEKISPKITDYYCKESNLDLPSNKIKDWSSACTGLSATIYDFTLFYGEDALKNRTYDNRIACMKMTKTKYNSDLEKLKEEEEEIKDLINDALL
ncbi:caspase domain protein [Anaerococcus hydrogenalis]|nr:caspase domain protein [Anaerococcus hydrogenalis]